MNKHVPHVLVLPEDDANRQLANAFVLDHGLDTRRIQVLPEAGGWGSVLESFKVDHVPDMERNPHRRMVLLIDFDERSDRLDVAMTEVPQNLRDRVYVVGVWSNPEKLRAELGQSYESIGLALARDCRENTVSVWSHPLLAHNADQLDRLRNNVQPILFSSAQER